MNSGNLLNREKGPEEENMQEESVYCKKGDSDIHEKQRLEHTENIDQNNLKIHQDNHFDDFHGEEECALEEKIKTNQHETIEDKQDKNYILNSKNEVELSDITFEDKGMSKADMFICKCCHRVFIDEYKLRSHLSKVHGIKKLGRPRKIKEVSETKELPEEKENWVPNVQKLAVRIDSGKLFVCDRCPYTVTRCDSMTKHILRVHSKGLVRPQYMCEICGKTFMDRAYLRNHGLSHIQEPQYFCEICGRRFHRQPSLRRHIQSHSEEKQFSCSLCDYQTNRKHLMYKHAENHRTGKAYGCKYCPDKFFTQMLLRKHYYTHHPSRYACSFCKIGFSSRERMWSHMHKIHFACEVKDLKTEHSTGLDEVKVEYIEVKLETKS